MLTGDINSKLKSCLQTETSPLGKEILGTLIENARVAREESSPMCQDTGMTVVFVRIGQNVQVTGGFIEDAINQGVRQGYEKGYLRKSVVKDPLHRENTRDNTPAVIHYEIVPPGDVFHITVSPKGFGSENKSALKMLTPSEGVEGVKRFVLETVSAAGGNPCPPIIVGVGIGGTMERAAYLSKKALLRPLDTQNPPDSALAALEAELLSEINKMGIGCRFRRNHNRTRGGKYTDLCYPYRRASGFGKYRLPRHPACGGKFVNRSQQKRIMDKKNSLCPLFRRNHPFVENGRYGLHFGNCLYSPR